MKLSLLPFIATLTAACGFAACGGSTANSNAAPPNDAGSTVAEGGAGDDGNAADASAEAAPPLDHGMPSTKYPAFMPDMPQINANQNGILSAPVIVPITWATDPNVTQLEAFADQLGTSDYWKTAVSEYGVGVATNGGHVHIPVDATHPLPSTISDAELDALVDQGAGSPATSGWPAPTAQTIYLVYIHPSITATTGGVSYCSQHIGGYHSASQTGNYIYAIAFSCTRSLDDLTGTASHELGEAATDPGAGVSGYIGFDTNHVSWSLFQHSQTENGDACEQFRESFYKEAAPFAFQVQRLWSNASAAAGHNPCVPATAGPYFGVTPTALETVSYAGRQGAIMTKGINIAVGMTKTFPVGFFSDAAMTEPITAKIAEGYSPLFGTPTTRNLSVGIDKTSGQNGEIAYATVTVNKAGATVGTRTLAKANYVTLLTGAGGLTHFMPILITNN